MVEEVQREKPAKGSKRVILWLLLLAIFMFGFGFLLVPIYNTMCQALGINGKIVLAPQATSKDLDATRWLSVQFITNYPSTLPWEFSGKTIKVRVHPGEMKRVSFVAKNNSNRTMTVQAIPSITPGIAAKYFKKTECFCFASQTLKPHQSMEMPLLFHIDKALPKTIGTITLSYTLFDITNRV